MGSDKNAGIIRSRLASHVLVELREMLVFTIGRGPRQPKNVYR